ncbi:hypothetical protein [Kitasatospora sp. NPDC088134]|uniref:DUF7848 domain-containing protein n=1 Tax=Kitasatospora sp. NPDC088134 TaxID=3364071 RepID=UPI0038277700
MSETTIKRFRNYTVGHDQSKPTSAVAGCDWRSEDGTRACDWVSGYPADVPELNLRIGRHCAATGHQDFRQTVSHAVSVTPGKWVGEL